MALFTKKGRLPYYTENGKTIKSNWETMDNDADKHIQSICNSMIKGDLSFKNGIKMFHETALIFEDADICKETTNPFIDFLIDISERNEEEVVALYNNIYDEVFDLTEE